MTTSHPTSTSVALGNERPARRSAPTPRSGLLAVLAVVALLVTGCTGGPGDKAEFIDVLMLDDNFTEAQATCIADAVFDTYGDDGDALQKISGADSWEYLIGEDGVEGFGPFFDETVNSCVTAGPSPDDT